MGKPAVIITIDGPAGSGKSTVAHRLARRLGLDFLDTGAMYRAAALAAIESRIDPTDGPAVAARVRELGVRFDWTRDPPAVLLGGVDVSERIRDLDVSGQVSVVAAHPEVRTVLVEWQRRIGREHPRLVTEGRDQGSTVFPDAPVRFYLTADERVRASRRVAQLESKGRPARAEAVIEDIRRRDVLDQTRRDAPLVRPEGAIDVDTGPLGLDEVVDALERHARERLPDAELDA